MKKKIKVFFVFIIVVVITILFCDYVVKLNAKEKMYSVTKEVPKNKVGLLLGTSKYLTNGNVNLYYKYRINAAVALFKAGKVKFILVSGDNSTKNYDEPTEFKEDLIKSGIPENKIFLDYAGFRTLDSVVRCKEIFGQESITIISQKFHNERAIYLSDSFGIKAIGFNAKAVSGRYGLRVTIREYLARVKLFVDVLIGVSPKFLGEKIKID